LAGLIHLSMSCVEKGFFLFWLESPLALLLK